jgi:hypothetical protein
MVSFEAGGLRILHLFPEPFSGYTSPLVKWTGGLGSGSAANASDVLAAIRRSVIKCFI